MLELNYTKRVTGGKIIIEVPEEFDGKELQISIKEAEKGEDNVEKWHELPAEKRLEILERYKGSAKFPSLYILLPIRRFETRLFSAYPHEKRLL